MNEDVANNLPACGLCLVTNGTGVCTKPEGHDYGHLFRTMRQEVSVSQSAATGTITRPRSCVGSGRPYALPPPGGTFSDSGANRAFYLTFDAEGITSTPFARCPSCQAMVQIINDRIPEHYGR